MMKTMLRGLRTLNSNHASPTLLSHRCYSGDVQHSGADINQIGFGRFVRDNNNWISDEEKNNRVLGKPRLEVVSNQVHLEEANKSHSIILKIDKIKAEFLALEKKIKQQGADIVQQVAYIAELEVDRNQLQTERANIVEDRNQLEKENVSIKQTLAEYAGRQKKREQMAYSLLLEKENDQLKQALAKQADLEKKIRLKLHQDIARQAELEKKRQQEAHNIEPEEAKQAQAEEERTGSRPTEEQEFSYCVVYLYLISIAAIYFLLLISVFGSKM